LPLKFALLYPTLLGVGGAVEELLLLLLPPQATMVVRSRIVRRRARHDVQMAFILSSTPVPERF
jgi:hypothetical protein